VSTHKHSIRQVVCAVLFCIFSLCVSEGQAKRPASEATNRGIAPVLHYIASDWDVLTRSMTRCDSIVDPKLAQGAVLYLPAGFPEPDSVKKLDQQCKVRIEHLPAPIEHPGQTDMSAIKQHGLLYLPNSYVVPGGRFNEMYGWDSYFIILGLVRDGRLDLARGMIENFFFEIEHYGTVLNANRTYYLTRSQPPFLSSMIDSVYSAQKEAGHPDKAWLARAYDIAAKDYENWIHDPHMAGSTGLSRYFDYGTGPAPESVQDETGVYRRVAGYFVAHPEFSGSYLVAKKSDTRQSDAGFSYGIKICDEPDNKVSAVCDSSGSVNLSPDYYKGDRSMRESGFDISFRFGPYGAATHHYAPVCLNSLLYKTEKDLQEIAQQLGKNDDAKKWGERAEQRKKLINQYLWDQDRGMFFDYNFDKSARSTYEYSATFYPLWAGLASPEQAQAVARNLKIFERPGGVAMSPYETGGQWDFPYGWAPLQVITVDGLRRYKFDADADRVSSEFLSTVGANFKREGTIREKYDVVTRSSEAHVTAGYQANVVGFGWTNGVYLQLLHELPKAAQEKLAAEQESAPGPNKP
jgi:alpha,alpha-trehalase